MPLITSRSELNQGFETITPATAIWATGTGADIRIHTGTNNDLPALAVGEFFEVRDHSQAVNNGLYEVVTVTTSTDDYECDKVSGSAPVVAGAEIVKVYGATGQTTEKSVFYDTAGLGIYLLEQGYLDAEGVTGQALYSHIMQEWKDDNFLIANGPFPVNAIDTDAGKYFIGQDAGGNNSGWTFEDDAGFSIRTRKLLRFAGWAEINSSGITVAQYFCAVTLGVFEDPANDTAFYQFGTDFEKDDTVDMDFAGPVNEAVQFYERLADDAINGGTGVAIDTTGRVLTRSDGGNWYSDGFKVGGQIEVRDAEDSTMDSTWLISGVQDAVDGTLTCGRAADSSAPVAFIDGGGGNDQLQLPAGESWTTLGFVIGSKMIITSAEDGGNDGNWPILAISSDERTADVATGTFTANADDETAVIGCFDDALTPDTAINAAINNSNAFRVGIRVRDADTYGKTYEEANLATIDKDSLGNFLFSFPLANATDQKIEETDANIDSQAPYTGMDLTFYATPQSRGGLVGGPYNFGIIMDGNNGTNQECFEWIQRQLRKLTDIDAGAGTAIGRAVGLLARFVGEILECGSGDGLSFPVNPQGGGSGFFIDNLNAASDNLTRFYDNTNTLRSKPESIAVTLDFNQIAIDDTATEYDLFFDRTIRTPAATLTDFVLTNATSKITSAGTNLPTNSEIAVGKYIRVSGLTGGDAPMNGVYQIVVINTPGADWTVVRYDGATIVDVASTAVDMDQNCVDTPDAIIVDTANEYDAATISFTAPDLINDSANGLGVYAVDDKIRVENSTGGLNDRIYKVVTASASQLEVEEQTIVTQGASPTVELTQVFSGDAVADVVENFAFDSNTQGGRTVSTTTYVKAKAIGQLDAQYVESPVATIASGTPVTIPLFSAQERNVV
jgi:hypothetical protein